MANAPGANDCKYLNPALTVSAYSPQRRKRLTLTKCKLPIVVERVEDYFVAHSPSLDLCATGDTENAATASLEMTVKLFLEDVIRRDVLQDVLKACGYQEIDTDDFKFKKMLVRTVKYENSYCFAAVPIPA